MCWLPRRWTAQQKPEATAILAQAREALGGENKLAEIKNFVVTGRTRRIQGSNLVPVEFEIAVEFPDKYVRKDEIPAQESGPTSTGFNGEEDDSAAGAGGAAAASRRPGAWGASSGPSWRTDGGSGCDRGGLPPAGGTPPTGARARPRLARHPPPGPAASRCATAPPAAGAPPSGAPAPPTAGAPPDVPPGARGMGPAGAAPGMPPGARAGGPPIDPRKARLYTIKQDFAKLTLGMFAASFPTYPLTFTYAGQAEAPQGKADVIDVKGEGNFALRLFINSQTHLPIMVSWTTPGDQRRDDAARSTSRRRTSRPARSSSKRRRCRPRRRPRKSRTSTRKTCGAAREGAGGREAGRAPHLLFGLP